MPGQENINLYEVYQILSAYFSQFELSSVFLSTFMAVIYGFFIGMERKAKRRMSGPKTCSLISLASCSFTIMGTLFSGPTADPTRVAAQIVSGIGFLGTAVIISKEGGKLGITSAATVWLTAAVGMALGVHEYILATWLFFLYMFITLFLVKVERFMFPKHHKKSLENKALPEKDLL